MSRPLLLLLAWLALNLIQAYCSPLDADETYYWMYARFLDWGYYDHPPAVAAFVALGKDWLPGALGLRFGHVLAGTATVAGLYHLLGQPKEKWLTLAALLIFAQPMLQVYGFIATPDGPLFLFTVLYLLAYRRFLKTPDLTSGALWGLTMAGLLYSKYHGLMLILFSVLPHALWLVRQPGAWLAALGGAALYFPHLYWQYAQDFPSFRYHLSGRNDAYQFKYTTEYVLNQLLIFNPLLVYHFVKTFRNPAAGNRFDRACRWLVVGFLLFFLWTTTRGGTEAQWTALLAIPLVYLLFTTIRDRRPEWAPLVRKLCIAGAILLVIGRLALLAPRTWLPFDKPFDHQPWVERLAAEAGELPVVIENSYRFASLYEFYSGGKPGWTFTNVNYRRNQYDLWTADRDFQDQTVFLLGQGNWKLASAQPFSLKRTDDMRVAVIDSFQVAKGVRLRPQTALPAVLKRGETYPLAVKTELPFPLRFDAPLPLYRYATLLYDEEELVFWRLESEGEITLPTTVPRGEARLELGLAYEGMHPLRGQSELIPVVIE